MFRGNNTETEDSDDTNESSLFEQQRHKHLYSVSPNNNFGGFTVKLFANYQNSEIKIFNLLRQRIEIRKIKNISEQSFTIDCFAKGQYTIIFIENEEFSASEKLIVEQQIDAIT